MNLTCGVCYQIFGLGIEFKLLNRFKVLDPDGNNYFTAQELQVGGSDEDDA